MLASIRSNLDEATASFWTDAELLAFANRAKDKVWVEVRKLKGNDFFTKTLASTASNPQTILGETYDPAALQVTVDGTELTLPHDFHELKMLEVITTGHTDVRFYHRDIAHRDFRDAREIAAGLTPGAFVFDIYGERTLVYAPKSNVALDTRLFYVYKPADLTTGADALDMPDPLYMAVEEYTTTRAQLKDRDELAAVWQQMGNKSVVDCLGAFTRQTQDAVFVEDAWW